MTGLELNAQKVLLSANGPGKTYEEINNAFAPGRDVVEVPDCVHTEFGRHIENDTQRKKRGIFYTIIIAFVFFASHYMAAN